MKSITGNLHQDLGAFVLMFGSLLRMGKVSENFYTKSEHIFYVE